MQRYKQKPLSLAVVAVLGISAPTIQADTLINLDVDGWWTMLGAEGAVTLNGESTAPFGLRTPINGIVTANIDTGVGSMSIAPFSFGGSGFASATSISFQAIGDGIGGPGTLLLGNMGFNWNHNFEIPVSIVWNAQGLFDAIGAGGLTTGSLITGGAVPASNNASFAGQNIPIGPAPLATTTWDTTDIGPNSLGTNPSGTLPLIADTTVNTNVTTGSEIGV